MINDELFLSVIIPVYNLESYIIPCIESVFANKNIDKDLYEVIVINDGSTDNTAKLVENYIKDHPLYNIRFVTQNNQGVSAARNKGLFLSKGEFVWFVDGDDAISDDSFVYLNNINREQIDLIRIGNCVDKYLFDNNSVLKSYKSFANDEEGYCLPAYRLLGSEFQHGHTTYIWRRKLLLEKSVCYPVGISQNEDYCFLIHALLNANVAYINLSFRFYICREREFSTSRGNYDQKRKERYVQNKFMVLNEALKITVDDVQKRVYLQNYLNYYVYVIVCDCFFRCFSFQLISKCLLQLKNLGVYPMQFSIPKVSKFRIWLFNHKFLFMIACFCYRIVYKLMK